MNERTPYRSELSDGRWPLIEPVITVSEMKRLVKLWILIEVDTGNVVGEPWSTESAGSLAPALSSNGCHLTNRPPAKT
ncbi:hypothetical protein [Streptomyces sp. SHP 1-2]|uniref:hypothetical protein n=1 Tax=Streptomyces sp. SHP 1-2 TaxID=2769489 RepID=UPI0022372C2E|nr:hypothetical protein [Streptomyces sp. SHP 1-2]MCW5249518.1 hypothetical protein [Streptomyces sp. SHP 1-2]